MGQEWRGELPIPATKAESGKLFEMFVAKLTEHKISRGGKPLSRKAIESLATKLVDAVVEVTEPNES